MDLDVYLNPFLTNFAQGYIPTNFYNRQFCTPINVLVDKGEYIINGNALQLVDTTRAVRTKAKTVELPDDKRGTYATKEHSIGIPLDQRLEIERAERRSAGHVIDLKKRAVRQARLINEMSREKLIADFMFRSDNYTNKKPCAAAEKWTTTTADIVAQIKEAKKAVYDKAGIEPNCIIMGKSAYDAAISNAKIKSAFQNIAVSVDLSMDQLKTAFGVKNIYVVDTMYQNKKGVMTKIWNTGTVSLVYQATEEEMALGYPVHTAVFDLIDSVAVREYADEEILKVAQYEEYDVKLVNKDNGYLITGAV